MLAGLLVFVLIAYGLERALTPDLPVRLGPVSALLMAGVPAMLVRIAGLECYWDEIERAERAFEAAAVYNESAAAELYGAKAAAIGAGGDSSRYEAALSLGLLRLGENITVSGGRYHHSALPATPPTASRLRPCYMARLQTGTLPPTPVTCR